MPIVLLKMMGTSALCRLAGLGLFVEQRNCRQREMRTSGPEGSWVCLAELLTGHLCIYPARTGIFCSSPLRSRLRIPFRHVRKEGWVVERLGLCRSPQPLRGDLEE